MNRLYSCSWIQNTGIINEDYTKAMNLINESIASILKNVKKKMTAAKIGVPYRDASLFFLRFLEDKHPDRIPEDFKARFATSKPQAKDINEMMGKMVMDENTPKGFFDKLGEQFDAYTDDTVKIGDKRVDNLTLFLNSLAGSREMRGVRTGVMGGEKKAFTSPEEIEKIVKTDVSKLGFTPGSSGFDTLTKNLEPDTKLVFKSTGSGGDIYEVMKGQYQFRVNIAGKQARDVTVGELSDADVKHVSVYDMSGKPQEFTAPNVKKFDVDPEAQTQAIQTGYTTRKQPFRKYEAGEVGPDFSKMPKDPDESPSDEYIPGFDDRPDIEEEEDEESQSSNGTTEITHHNPNMPDKEVIVVRMSNAAVNQKMRDDYNKKQKDKFRTQQKYHLGY